MTIISWICVAKMAQRSDHTHPCSRLIGSSVKRAPLTNCLHLAMFQAQTRVSLRENCHGGLSIRSEKLGLAIESELGFGA